MNRMFSVEKVARIVEGELLRGGNQSPARAIHDSRLVRPGDLFVALPGHRSDGHRYLVDAFDRGACAALVSDTGSLPSNARNLIVVNDSQLALQQLASAWRDTLAGTFIGITGSNGKTTVKALLGHLLSAHDSTYTSPLNYNTEIGLPVALLSMPVDARFGVFELGAERPGDVRRLARILRPQFGVITSVGPSHLDGFETIDAVASEKWSLVEDLPKDGMAILNADSSYLLQRTSTAKMPVISTGLTGGDLRGQVIQAAPHLEVELEEHNVTMTCPLIGTHNANNLLLAAATANALGMSWDLISTTAASFEPTPHRLNPIRTSFGTILDDTYNANPASMTAALQMLAAFGDKDSARTFVFGEMHELGGDTERYHREIVRLALSLPIDVILPIGKAAIAACRAADASKVVLLPREEMGRYLARQPAPRRPAQSTVVLIKGSRVLELETLVEELQAFG